MGVKKKKWFYLNLNSYRNWHYQTSNKLKQEFKKSIEKQLETLDPIGGKISIVYKIYSQSERRFDIMNIGSVVDKFLCDALQEYDVLKEDNYDHVVSVKYQYAGKKHDYHCCEVNIYEEI